MPQPPELLIPSAVFAKDFDNLKAIEWWAADYMDLTSAPSRCRLFIPHKNLHELSPSASQDNWNAIERWATTVISGSCGGGVLLSSSCLLFIPFKTVLGDLHAGRITLSTAQAREFDNYKTVENWANRLHRGEC